MKHIFTHIDWWIFTPVLFLIIISLTVLFSINPEYFRNQAFGLLVSVIAFLVISQISPKDLRLFSFPGYILSAVLLITVFVIGFESRGAVRWFEIFGKSFQASEISKPLLSLAFAEFLAYHSNKKISTYLLTLIFLIPIVFLIYIQPDLGNAILYLGVVFITLLTFGMPYLWFTAALSPVILLFPLIWNSLHNYQRLRILTFFNPMHDPRGSSYNLVQAIIAVGSGMLFGRGFSSGSQSQLKFLPENHTDFIFSSLAEKLGFIGSMVLIVFFMVLFIRLYQIFIRSDDVFSKVFTACSMLFLFLQFTVNIGMNVGLVPVVGVTLPFVSYGGSSLLANFIMIGILSSISVGSRKDEVLEIR